MDMITMFNLIDSDQSGEITHLELVSFMKANNFKEEFVDRWLDLFDLNNRGRITIEDFCERLGLEIDEHTYAKFKKARPSVLNLDSLDNQVKVKDTVEFDEFVDVDSNLDQQIVHVSIDKPLATPIHRNNLPSTNSSTPTSGRKIEVNTVNSFEDSSLSIKEKIFSRIFSFEKHYPKSNQKTNKDKSLDYTEDIIEPKRIIGASATPHISRGLSENIDDDVFVPESTSHEPKKSTNSKQRQISEETETKIINWQKNNELDRNLNMNSNIVSPSKTNNSLRKKTIKNKNNKSSLPKLGERYLKGFLNSFGNNKKDKTSSEIEVMLDENIYSSSSNFTESSDTRTPVKNSPLLADEDLKPNDNIVQDSNISKDTNYYKNIFFNSFDLLGNKLEDHSKNMVIKEEEIHNNDASSKDLKRNDLTAKENDNNQPRGVNVGNIDGKDSSASSSMVKSDKPIEKQNNKIDENIQIQTKANSSQIDDRSDRLVKESGSGDQVNDPVYGTNQYNDPDWFFCDNYNNIEHNEIPENTSWNKHDAAEQNSESTKHTSNELQHLNNTSLNSQYPTEQIVKDKSFNAFKQNENKSNTIALMGSSIPPSIDLVFINTDGSTPTTLNESNFEDFDKLNDRIPLAEKIKLTDLDMNPLDTNDTLPQPSSLRDSVNAHDSIEEEFIKETYSKPVSSEYKLHERKTGDNDRNYTASSRLNNEDITKNIDNNNEGVEKLNNKGLLSNNTNFTDCKTNDFDGMNEVMKTNDAYTSPTKFKAWDENLEESGHNTSVSTIANFQDTTIENGGKIPILLGLETDQLDNVNSHLNETNHSILNPRNINSSPLNNADKFKDQSDESGDSSLPLRKLILTNESMKANSDFISQTNESRDIDTNIVEPQNDMFPRNDISNSNENILNHSSKIDEKPEDTFLTLNIRKDTNRENKENNRESNNNNDARNSNKSISNIANEQTTALESKYKKTLQPIDNNNIEDSARDTELRHVKIVKDEENESNKDMVNTIIAEFKKYRNILNINYSEIIKRYLDKHYRPIWHVIISADEYCFNFSYEDIIMFEYDELMFTMWQTPE